ELERERHAVDDERVPRVVAALVADDHGHLLGDEVGELPLALVAPLRTDDDSRWHWDSPLSSRPGLAGPPYPRARSRPEPGRPPRRGRRRRATRSGGQAWARWRARASTSSTVPPVSRPRAT